MDQPTAERLVRTLEEIRDNQRLQLERQSESLALQREQLALVKHQAERTERIQDRAERIQDRSAQIVNIGRRLMIVIVPILIALLIYVTWLIFRR